MSTRSGLCGSLTGCRPEVPCRRDPGGSRPECRGVKQRVTGISITPLQRGLRIKGVVQKMIIIPIYWGESPNVSRFMRSESIGEMPSARRGLLASNRQAIRVIEWPAMGFTVLNRL
jgi:hypothetical protein